MFRRGGTLMPEKSSYGRDRPHALLPAPGSLKRRLRRPGEPAYAELLAASNFSFLRGASHPEELAATAAELGLAGFAVADRNTLAGVVRGHLAAKTVGIRYAVGCRLSFRDGTPDIAAWPTDRAAYGRLCRLLTTGNLRAKKGECHLDLADLLEWGEGLGDGGAARGGRGREGGKPRARSPNLPLEGRSKLAERSGSELREGGAESRGPAPLPKFGRVHAPRRRFEFRSPLKGEVKGDRRSACDHSRNHARHACRSLPRPRASRRHLPLSRRRCTPPCDASPLSPSAMACPCWRSATCSTTRPSGGALQDVLSCVREHKTLDNAGRLLEMNAERHMKSAAEMERLFRMCPAPSARRFACWSGSISRSTS